MKKDYSALDALILERIRSSNCTLSTLELETPIIVAANAFSNYKRPIFRIIDSRLQALRKQEKISYVVILRQWKAEPIKVV